MQRSKFSPSLLLALSAVGAEAAAASGTGTAAPAPKEPEIPVGQRVNEKFKFHFRTDKIRDNEGKPIGNGRKHPDIEVVFPIPTYQDLIGLMQQGGKEAELILEAVIAEIDRAARNQINDFREDKGLDVDFKPEMFDLAKLNITAIANTPRGERGGPEISDESWTAFLEDYKTTMVDKVGYDKKKVELAQVHFKVQFRRIKNDKAAVKKLLDLLMVWASNSDSVEDHTQVFEDLSKRANKYLLAEEKNVSEAL